jgi:DNA-binding SARP family transcriptional activator
LSEGGVDGRLASRFRKLGGLRMGARIQICGRVAVQIDGRRVEGHLPGRQGRSLLVYLAANRDHPLSRDELIEALWPGELPPRPEAALSALLSKVRSALGPASIEGRSQVRLLVSDAWIDLEAAAMGIHRAESAVALGDWAGAAGPARVALHTANRGILPGADAPWIIELRRRLDDMRLRALACVGTSSLRIGGAELPAAERSARALVRLAPFREAGHGLLMEALAAQGNTAEALRVYDDLRHLLRDELGTAPSVELQALHRRLLGPGPGAGAGRAPGDDQLAKVAERRSGHAPSAATPKLGGR